MDKREEIEVLIKIFEQYPPLTTRMELQIKFMRTCLDGVTMDRYFIEREKKFEGQPSMIKQRNEQVFKEPAYFNI